MRLFSSFPVILVVVTMASLATALATTPSKKTVLVSGAGGQTGQALFRQLLAYDNDSWHPIGLVRNEERRAELLEAGDIPAEHVQVCDVTDAAQVQAVVQNCPYPVGAFGICTSAKPSPTGATNPDTGRPVYGFPRGDPELVDWTGQKNQIDACPDGAHIILCSTMGGTNADHPLNALGDGMIVQWKRKSEVYLMAQKRLRYTIVHPGGLLNGPGGQRELVVGVDDDLLATGTNARTIPREDVASLMRAALLYPDHYAGRSFDVGAKEEEGEVNEDEEPPTVTTDWEHLLDALQGQNCDYSLGKTM